MKPLILTSDSLPPVAEETTEDAPRTDYLELARRLDADVSYVPRGGGAVKQVEKKLAMDVRQAIGAGRNRAPLYFSLSEKVGIPLALLQGLSRKRVPHVMVAHYLTSEKKRSLQRRTGYLHRFDCLITLCRAQEQYLLREVDIAPEKVRFVYDKVDSRFWTPDQSVAVESDLVLAVGRERRDYETLMTAAQRLPHLRFVIVASSPWSKGTEAQGRNVPDNVTVQRGLTWETLRDSYRRASLVVVPLQAECEYAAGVNAVLEAMSMQKTLIVSRTPGIADYVQDGENGIWTQAGDAEHLARQITRLHNDTALSARLARNARATVDGGRNLDTYIDRLVAAAEETAARPTARQRQMV